MRRIIIMAAVTALTVARPEVYKEQEDFKYARSSSDEGSKSGYYGAQRGNMGGNYERAHNMDSLAQHQMSGLVNQVDGELGEGAKTKSGSVYTAANSRGIYGSGNYDLSNLAGRNFQEGTSFADSQSRSSSSQSSSAFNNAAYTNSRTQSSRYGGYQAAGHTDQTYQAGVLQPLDNTQGATGAWTTNGQQSSSGYRSHSGYNSHSSFGSSDAHTHSGNNDGSEVRTRLISAVPVKIVFRPGTRVAIPIGAQTYDINQGSAVYDANQRSSSYDANQRSSLYDQSSVNSEAEALNRNNAYKPATDAKHYESSYSYRKEWERHNTIAPSFSIPTVSPLPQNSELYEDSQSRASNHQYDAVATGSHATHSSNAYTGYNTNVKSSFGQSGYPSDLNSLHHQSTAGSNLNAYTQTGYNTGSNADLNSQVENINSQKPKSFHSSYSYHKSWERQGDPYEIKPASNGHYDSQSSQRFSAGTKSGSYNTGSHHQSQVDCDEICGHARVARSYDTAQYQQELGQQAQNLADFGQQSQNLEDFGQQSQNLEDFGQQSQKLEDFGQQSQQSEKLEDLGQQTQSKWDKLEDLGQHSQNTWDKYEDLGQQVQNKSNQQNQNTWERAEDIGQQTQHNPAQYAQDIWNKQETKPQVDDQQTQNTWDLVNTNGENQQITQHQNLDTVPYNEINQPGRFSQSPQNENEDHKHRVESIWDKLNTDTMQNNNDNAQKMQEQALTEHLQYNNDRQQIQSTYGHNWNMHTTGIDTSHTQNNRHELTTNNEAYSHNFQSHSQHNSALFNLWNKLDTIEKQLIASSNKSIDVKYNSSSENTTSQSSNQTSRHEQTYYEEGLVNTTNSYHYEKENKTFNFNNVQSSDNYDRVRSQDIGRGDIGPEDLSAQSDVDVTEKTLDHPNIGKKPLIPVASGVLNINNEMNDKDSTDNQTTERYERNPLFVPHVPTSIFINHNTEHNVSSQNNDRRFEILGKEIETFGQQNIDNLEQKTQGSQNFEAHEKEQKINDLGIQNTQQKDNQVNENIQQQIVQDNGQLQKNLAQQNVQDIGQLNENLEQQNLQNFSQQNANLEQQNLQNFREVKVNLEQQNVQYFGQQNENMDQQNVQDFGQVNENLEQQNIQDFGQQNENLEQQNLQNFGQTNENMDQQNVQDFGQQNENLEQQNLQNFGQTNENMDQQNVQDFGQQNENLEQQNLQDFGQTNENMDQQNVQDFGQVNENLEQLNVQDLGQQNENLEQQNLQDFGQTNEKMDQQNVQDFGQVNENLEQQNVQDLGQQNENMEQQNLQDFGQTNENMDQQNVQHFGQANEHLEQQNIQDVGQQNQNLEQQNLQDFGQTNENMDQQNIQDFGQINENMEQQNVQDLDQQNENLEQQNLQDFGQTNENMDQQNVQDFGQVSKNLEQQNVQAFGHQHFAQNNRNPHLGYQYTNHGENLEQQNQQNYDLQQENVGQGRENYNQHDFHQFQQGSISNFEQQQSNNREPLKNNGPDWRPRPEKMEVIPVVKTTQNINLQSTPPKSPEIEPPPEPATEKPGFWKSVGSKFVSAKDKVFSWFGSQKPKS